MEPSFVTPVVPVYVIGITKVVTVSMTALSVVVTTENLVKFSKKVLIYAMCHSKSFVSFKSIEF